MFVRDLDDNTSMWHLTGRASNGRIAHKSSFHLEARALLTSYFPTLQILEEIPISIRKSETLYLDFYLPLIKTCVEVHGQQHYEFVPFYHHDIRGFWKTKKRDREKTDWCAMNNIRHVALPYNETIDQWKERVQK